MSEQYSNPRDEADEHHDDEPHSPNEDIENNGSSDTDSTSSQSDSDALRIWWPEHIGLDVETLRKEALSGNLSSCFGNESGQLNPNLCAFCRVFFDDWEDVTMLFNANPSLCSLETSHFENRESLVDSSRRGCHLCKYFVHLIRLEESSGPQSEFELRGIMELAETSNFESGDHGHSHEDNWRLSLSVGKASICEVFLVPTDLDKTGYKIDESVLYSDQTNLLRPVDSFHNARGWLEECGTSHDCHVPETQGPTRLLKINDNKIRLCLPQTEHDYSSMYATLSHCWGKLPIVRLLQQNIDEFMKQIPHDTLSKTFSDAIEIARKLSFNYIWIDSLCIMQDDPEDWAREAGLMAEVYGSSSLNIAATASPDGSKGCLFYRDAVYVQAGKVKVNRARKAYRFYDQYLFSRNLIDNEIAPLSNRAWVLQERLLAPRTLHFTNSQLFWECGSKFACDAFPDHVSDIFRYNDFSFTAKEVWTDWRSIVRSYCATDLTETSDKLVALAGIARRISDRTGDSYYAGLWKSNFLRGLCWYVHKSDMHETFPTTPSTGMVFPSWSWTSIHGQLHAISDFSAKLDIYHSEIVDIDVVLGGPDPFGNITKGILTIKSNFLVWASEMLDSHMRVGSQMVWDCERYEENYAESYEENDIMLLSLGIFDLIPTVTRGCLEMLVLVPTRQRKGEYRRIGRYRLHQNDSSVLLMDVRSRILDDAFELRDPSHLASEEDCVSIGVNESGDKWYEITIV